VRDPEPIELPRGEPRPLQHRPGLADPHAQALATLRSRADHADGRAVADARQRAGVAVREHAPAVRHERSTVRSDRAVHRYVGRRVCLRGREGGRSPTGFVRGERVVDAVGEVHRGRARVAHSCGIGTHLRAAQPRVRGQRHAVRARRAERRRTPDHEVADRLNELDRGCALHEAQPLRKGALVDQPDPSAPPGDSRRDRVRTHIDGGLRAQYR
jgi:hypothetical protein